MAKKVSNDIHILRYFSSSVTVVNGKVTKVTSPTISRCPLAGHLYKGFRNVKGRDKDTLKREIKAVIESKIEKYGFFTTRRIFTYDGIRIPYGASEMMMSALQKRAVDAAVIACDGAGTVVTSCGDLAQGIGARMHSLILTSPIPAVIGRLKKRGCIVVSDKAVIDTPSGVKKAIEKGYKRIAVTVTGRDSRHVRTIRELETAYACSITVLAICTTGLDNVAIQQIKRDADIVWSCASGHVRKALGRRALVQVSQQAPVFVLTEKGLTFLAAYADDGRPLRGLDPDKQYLIYHGVGATSVRFGLLHNVIREAKLPA
jgi:putative methanogenesis marker protein 8